MVYIWRDNKKNWQGKKTQKVFRSLNKLENFLKDDPIAMRHLLSGDAHITIDYTS